MTKDGIHTTAKPKSKIPASSVIKPPTKKKPKDKPKRPLSAYNFFFKEERGKIVKAVLSKDEAHNPPGPDHVDEELMSKLLTTSGKVSFEEIGKLIGRRWKSIDEAKLARYTELASTDAERYKNEMIGYNVRQEANLRSDSLKQPQMYGGPFGGPGFQNGMQHTTFNPQSGGYLPPHRPQALYEAPPPPHLHMGIPSNSCHISNRNGGASIAAQGSGLVSGAVGGPPGGQSGCGGNGMPPACLHHVGGHFGGGGETSMYGMGAMEVARGGPHVQSPIGQVYGGNPASFPPGGQTPHPNFHHGGAGGYQGHNGFYGHQPPVASEGQGSQVWVQQQTPAGRNA